ncbi:MAG: transposon-encoded TnpW family protein [Oscillospiraceae bacterium]|nr:transposon-encoded TnpW family protein [Oscillospiraceae bacterium]
MTEATAEKRVSAGAAATSRTRSEPVRLLKRIGSTTFVVSVRFSSESAETLEEKLLRLIGREVDKIA